MQDVCRQFASETSGKKKYELFMQVSWAASLLATACKQLSWVLQVATRTLLRSA